MWTTATLHEQLTAVGGQSTFDALGGFSLTEKHNITGVIRVHFNFIHRAGTLGSSVQGAFGLIIVEDDAMAVPQVPEPFNGDGDAPWQTHQFYHSESNVDESQRIIGDSRSRRRIGLKQTLAFVLDVATGSNDSVEWGIGLRILLQRRR